MKRMKAVLSFAALCLSAAAGSVADVSTAAATQKGRGPSQVERGRAVYAANCVRCHGADGAGRTRMADIVEPPDLSDAAWQRKRGSAKMVASVSNGLGQMPAFKKKLSRQEIAASVAYVRTLKR
jgi:cbb3-type cytochrome c oxidase subunit III